ncbi:universal stress protein [Streptomyces sp. NPDC001714]|uniref:universal stress protein n=1 Tax=Streptomyces sp. NPDC001714 TaxID=3364603 RepID=UPI003693241B
MTLRHIVVGVDGSLTSVRALDRAAAEAVRHGCTLRMLYAVPDRDEAAPVLASAVSRTSERCPGLSVETVAAEGGVVQALARESEDAVLTVVGTRGLGTVAGSALGSVSLRLAALAQGPLLVVRGDHPCAEAGPVLLGLSDDSDVQAAEYAFQEAERRGASLRVLHSRTRRHITPELPPLTGVRSSGPAGTVRESRAEEAVARYALGHLQDRHPDVVVESDTVRTGPAPALLTASQEAAVVVVGTHRRTGVLGPRLGPVVHTLLHRSHCPLVVVPEG